MKIKYFAVYDKVSDNYGEPFLAQRDEIAIRKFKWLMQAQPMIAADCELWCIGSYDFEKGILVSDKQFICKFDEDIVEAVANEK